ncbi:hypothetical protein ZIOFF_073618 [Zingiber officinale]|uniref:Late embryogenesis abundant protein LEA-2 subgroup domain-containing protein n=1 Tax=Zingiber officinale TaxID=94328 RepID=A0A8J5BYV5_ZINOF|nr:hypothetical protein ZIOFF_073618 [Zingiber officinale]
MGTSTRTTKGASFYFRKQGQATSHCRTALIPHKRRQPFLLFTASTGPSQESGSAVVDFAGDDDAQQPSQRRPPPAPTPSARPSEAAPLPRHAHGHPFLLLFLRRLLQGLLLLPLPTPHLPRPPRRRRRSCHRPRPQAQEAPVRPPAGGRAGGSPPAAYLSLNISLLFIADNPNKVGIRYEAAALDVMYRGVPLGVATVPGFEQPAHSSRLVQTRVAVDRFNVLQADALNLVRDAAINDRVDLRLTGDVAAKILLLGISTPRVQAKQSGSGSCQLWKTSHHWHSSNAAHPISNPEVIWQSTKVSIAVSEAKVVILVEDDQRVKPAWIERLHSELIVQMQ